MTESSKYPAFGKIPRLNRQVIWTEKIDGTNGLISIEAKPFGTGVEDVPLGTTVVIPPGVQVDEQTLDPIEEFWVKAGSRNRWLNESSDNYGFARWVRENALVIADWLGEGQHYGEWWGQGIQRRYGLDHKRFSLFNVSRWGNFIEAVDEAAEIGLGVVPLLGMTTGLDATMAVNMLREYGSVAAPGYNNPEGVIGYHTGQGNLFKVLLENDDQPKGN